MKYKIEVLLRNKWLLDFYLTTNLSTEDLIKDYIKSMKREFFVINNAFYRSEDIVAMIIKEDE